MPTSKVEDKGIYYHPETRRSKSAAAIFTPTMAAQYQEKGYVVIHRPLVSLEDHRGLAEIYWEMRAALPPGGKFDELDEAHRTRRELFRFLQDPRLLDVVGQVLYWAEPQDTKRDIALLGSHFIDKQPGGVATSPHEDGYFWKPVFGGIPQRGLTTLWYSLTGATKRNGAMTMLPESHLGDREFTYRPSDLPNFAAEVAPEEVDVGQFVALEMEAGEGSFHHPRIVHASLSNATQDTVRAAFAVRFFDPRLPVDAEANNQRAIYLLRGDAEDYPHNIWTPVPAGSTNRK